MSTVEWVAHATGIACATLAVCTFLVAVCTATTMIRDGKASLMLGSILSAAVSATIAGTSVAFMWLYPWSASQALACNIVAGWMVTFSYCLTVGSVLQFLYCRALLVDETAGSTPLMKLIQIGIIGVIPFAIVMSALSSGGVDETYGMCVLYEPVYMAVLMVVATATFSVLLIYKFTMSLREHQARMTSPSEKGAGTHARNDKLAQIARRNLFFSSIALGGTTSTMVCLLVNDILFPPYDPLHMAIENLVGSIDVAINITVICTCSTAWIPQALKTVSMTRTHKLTTADTHEKPHQSSL